MAAETYQPTCSVNMTDFYNIKGNCVRGGPLPYNAHIQKNGHLCDMMGAASSTVVASGGVVEAHGGTMTSVYIKAGGKIIFNSAGVGNLYYETGADIGEPSYITGDTIRCGIIKPSGVMEPVASDTCEEEGTEEYDDIYDRMDCSI